MQLAKVIAPWCGFLALALLTVPHASAGDDAGLPGGATSLREAHGDGPSLASPERQLQGQQNARARPPK